SPDVEEQAILPPYRVGKPVGGHLRASRTVLDRLAYTDPRPGGTGWLPAQSADWRSRIRDTEERRSVRQGRYAHASHDPSAGHCFRSAPRRCRAGKRSRYGCQHDGAEGRPAHGTTAESVMGSLHGERVALAA